MNWLGDRHEGVGVRGAAEGEPHQRHAPDRALLDRPGHRLRIALLQQDPRHHRADPEPEVRGHPVLQLHRRAPRDDLLDPVLGEVEARPRPHDLARDRRVVERLGRLQLVGIDDHEVDEMPRHPHVVRPQRPRRRHPLHLRDDEPAVVADRDRLVEPAEIGALVLVGEVAVLVRRGRPDDRHVRDDVREVQPGLAAELDAADDRLRRGARRSSRSPRGSDRRRCRARPGSAPPAAAPPRRGACRRGCPRARCRPRPDPRSASARSPASAATTARSDRSRR